MGQNEAWASSDLSKLHSSTLAESKSNGSCIQRHYFSSSLCHHVNSLCSAMKWDSTQKRFLVIFSRINPCPNACGVLLNGLSSSNNDRCNEKGGRRVGTWVFLLGRPWEAIAWAALDSFHLKRTICLWCLPGLALDGPYSRFQPESTRDPEATHFW